MQRNPINKKGLALRSTLPSLDPYISGGCLLFHRFSVSSLVLCLPSFLCPILMNTLHQRKVLWHLTVLIPDKNSKEKTTYRISSKYGTRCQNQFLRGCYI